jgi:hypothetical protein
VQWVVVVLQLAEPGLTATLYEEIAEPAESVGLLHESVVFPFTLAAETGEERTWDSRTTTEKL